MKSPLFGACDTPFAVFGVAWFWFWYHPEFYGTETIPVIPQSIVATRDY